VIDNVVFDLGGVLLDWNPRYLYRKLLAEAEMETFLATVCTPDWNARQDEGRPWSEAIAELSAAHPAHAHLIAAYLERWPEMLAGEMPGARSLLQEVAHLRRFALTNWSAETFPHAAAFGFMDAFEDVIVSGQLRLAKPDPRIFTHLTDKHRLRPERTLLIDDRADNCLAARSLGWQAIQFFHAPEVSRKLQSLLGGC
jgi:2-haloacid dehalogenase